MELTFSQKLKRLEEIVKALEAPDVELEEGLKLLEEGVKLHQECQSMLTQTQTKITKLLDTNAQPTPLDVIEEKSVPVVKKEDADEPTDLFASVEVRVDESDEGLPF